MQNIVTFILAFISTNIDDLFILMLFFGETRLKAPAIITGQFLGISSLVIVSLIGSYIGNFVDQRYAGLLGLFPIYLAIRQWLELAKPKASEEETSVDLRSGGMVAIALVTIANGGDNIGVYVPLLTTMSQMQRVEMILVFAIMTFLWCVAAKYLSSRAVIAHQLDRFGHLIMPVVLFLLGVFIIVESGSISLFRF